MAMHNAQASAVQSWVEEKKRDDEDGDEEAERGTGRRVEAVAGVVADASETNLDGDEEQPEKRGSSARGPAEERLHPRRHEPQPSRPTRVAG